MRKIGIFATSLLFLLTLSSLAMATNGMETTASGARAAGMGGVDLAIALDTTAINTNPAGLTQLMGSRIDFGSGLLIPSLHFKNDLNDEDGKTQFFPMPELSYAYRFHEIPLALGLGIFAQGGMGADFKLEHPLLGKDTKYFSNIAYMKIAPAAAIQPVDWFGVGLALNIGYASMGMEMPYTVSPSLLKGVTDPSTGMTFGDMFSAPSASGGLGYDELVAKAKLEDATAWGFGAKLGMMFTPLKGWNIGVAYTTKSTLNFSGTMKMDMSAQFNDAFGRMVQGAMAQGLSQEAAMQAVAQQLGQLGIDTTQGMKGEYDAEIKFAWPQKAGLGMSFNFYQPLLVGFDVTWINWSDTMENFDVTLKNGDNANINRLVGGKEIKDKMPLEWSDQYVVAVGVQYEFIKDLFGRVGYNYGKNPVPADTVFPIFPAIVEHHISGGLGYQYKFFGVNAAYEYAVPNTQKADDTHQIASEYAGSESTLGESTANLMLSFVF
ncbi:MAG: hypothetical protein GX444_03030 [Myxococcales bacterium]|nr:hypothetical protein [Myxococcales bacterium]